MSEDIRQTAKDSDRRAVATLGGGCFWCLEAVFEGLAGVESVISGYTGGYLADPTYKQICTGTTGHAEVVQVKFDPSQVSYNEILDVFFTIHDPTTLNRQGADVGTQYRSVIFYHDEDQRTQAAKFIKDLSKSGTWNDPIVTELAPIEAFYIADDYHQEYYQRNGFQPYCRMVIAPKVDKFRKKFGSKLKSD